MTPKTPRELAEDIVVENWCVSVDHAHFQEKLITAVASLISQERADADRRVADVLDDEETYLVTFVEAFKETNDTTDYDTWLRIRERGKVAYKLWKSAAARAVGEGRYSDDQKEKPS